MRMPQLRAMPQAERGTLLWHHAWTAVLAANLVVPMGFASSVIGKGGRAGMALAVGVLWLAGDMAGSLSRRTRSALLYGGVVVALTQLLPLLQMIAGAISL